MALKVLIVGGAGYLGGALTDILGSKFDFKVYDNLTFEEAYLKPVPFVFGDIRDRDKLKEQLDWADSVVWLAALVGDGACAISPDTTLELNQEAVKWLSENFDGRIIFMSTCSVYGAREGELAEDSPTNPLSAYAVTKLAAEQYLRHKNALIFRLGTLYGLGDIYSRIRLDLVVNTLTTKAVTEGKLTVFGGNQFRPLLHVKDAAEAIAKNLESKDTGIYNLHQENIKILDLAYQIQEFAPRIKINVVGTTFEDSRNYKVNSEKARSILRFNPHYTTRQGIQEVMSLIASGRIKDVNNPRYSNQGFLEVFRTHEIN